MSDQSVQLVLEEIARDSHAKLLAFLAGRYSNDIAAAEDALADAVLKAFESWQANQVPSNPKAWLLRVAQNRLRDEYRRRKVSERLLPVIANQSESIPELDENEIPDERLQLLFACAHPAIDHSVRTPLVLQVVMGIPAERIADAFLVSSRTMAQRLVRGKRKIRDAGICLSIPSVGELNQRLTTVHETIYAAFFLRDHSMEQSANHLSIEAIRLAEMLVELLPGQPESMGLLALMLYIQSRAATGDAGEFIPLDRQAPESWDKDIVLRAESLLAESAKFRQVGRYQLEAAIQSAHMQRLFGRAAPGDHILSLYEALTSICPVVGVRVAHAAALLQANRPIEALEILDNMNAEYVSEYQPYWAVRAFVCRRLQRGDIPGTFRRAIGLCSNLAVRKYLTTELARLGLQTTGKE